MKFNTTIKVFTIYGSLFILSSVLIYFLEIVFPYTYFQNNDEVNKNYFIYTLILFLITILLVFIIFFKKTEISFDLNETVDIKFLQFVQFLTILGIIVFILTKLFIMKPQFQLEEYSFCNLGTLRMNWIKSGSYDQLLLYKILSPVGMLFINFSFFLLYINVCKKKLHIKYRFQNYFLIILSSTVVFFVVYSKNYLLQLIFFVIIFNLFNFIKNKKIRILESFFIIFLSLCLISSFFHIRKVCKHSNQNFEFENKISNLENFNNIVYDKKENLIRSYIKENERLNFFIYYLVHSKQNSDLLFNKINNNYNLEQKETSHVYIKDIIKYVSRDIFFKDFDRGKYFLENYKYQKPRGGLNLQIYLWESYRYYGIIFFNLVFFILLRILNTRKMNLIFSRQLTSFFQISLMLIYFHNLLFANLFVGINAFPSLLIYICIIFCLFVDFNQFRISRKK